MPTLALDGRLVYFAHCPKAGGTSLERFMVDRWGGAVGMLGWGWDRRWARRGARPGEIPCSPQHLVWADAEALLPRPPDHVFALVREPLARMASEYRYQRQGRLTGPAGRPLRRLGFSSWLRLMLAVADRNPYTHDNHFRPQAEFLPRAGTQVFRLEDGAEAAARWLCDRLGAPEPGALPHELGGAGGPPVRPSRQDAALVAARYAEDYRRFGYPLPDPDAFPDDPHAALRTRLARAAAPAIDRLYRRGLV